ncbi:MAG: hypothetical protein ACREEM_35465, partial [Blastocatellia bacterium]
MRVSRWPDNAGAVIFLCFLIGLIGLIGWTDPGLAQSGPKRIYIAPDDHTDYLWSGDEEAYRQAFIEMIDYYLDLADTTEKNPSEHQSRWNCDGSFWVWEYERSKPVADVQRLVRRIRDGHISVPLNALVSTYGGAVIRAKLSSDGGHYSPTHSRLDWLTLNHYAAMSGDDGAGIVLSSADLSFMKLGRSAVV